MTEAVHIQTLPPDAVHIDIERASVFYGQAEAIRQVSCQLPWREVTAFIGPSGCGKSTLLRAINRMNDTIPGSRLTGHIRLKGRDIYAPSVDVPELRRHIGMVFQKPNPFPTSIFDNVAYGPRIAGLRDRDSLEARVRESLEAAALWEEVHDRLHRSALSLSGGQQQRLCIARALAVGPEVLLMDEPTSALDPIASEKIERLIHTLRERLTVVIVTHNMQQATRVSQHTAFFYLGTLIEYAPTQELFGDPKIDRTRAYISGRFG